MIPTWSLQVTKTNLIFKCQPHGSRLLKSRKPVQRSASARPRLRKWPIFSSKPFPWEASTPYASLEGDSIIKGSDIVDPIGTEDAPQFPLLDSEQNIIDMKNHLPSGRVPLKWPMWILAPSVLLATGVVPTLWLPLSSVFIGPSIAGVLSLIGLDCIFNMGATLFLLMADTCARFGRKYPSSCSSPEIQIPLTYKFWNLTASLMGFIAPLIMFFLSCKGSVQPQLPSILFAVLLGPYLLLLSVQMLTEVLTWHWRSPVWLLAPIVYEVYRVLQLMRGLRLMGDVEAPLWTVQCIRGLVSWWVLILGVQLMRIAWFVGLSERDLNQNQF